MPATATKLLGVVLALAGVAAAPALGGCAAADGTDASAMDAALPPDDSEGGVRDYDAGASVDAARAADGAVPASPGENLASDGLGCFDFVDSDGDSLADCADLECAVTPHPAGVHRRRRVVVADPALAVVGG